MSLAEKLACANDRRDEALNILLAEQLATKSDVNSETLELFGIVKHGSKPQRHDAIKVLYELAARRPEALADKLDLIVDFFPEKDNRVLWGLLTLVANIAKTHPSSISTHLDVFMDAARAGSVIAKDRAVEILCALIAHQQDDAALVHSLFEFLDEAAINQLPNYAEQAARVLPKQEASKFMDMLTKRLDEPITAAKRKRLEKAIAKMDADKAFDTR